MGLEAESAIDPTTEMQLTAIDLADSSADKAIVLLKRNRNLQFREFDAYWERVHGPLVLSMREYKAYRRRYVQDHLIQGCLDERHFPFDGITQIWPTKSPPPVAFDQTSEFVTHVIPDELKMLERDASIHCLARESVLREGRGECKLMVFMAAHSDVPLEECHLRFRTEYAHRLLTHPDVDRRVRGLALSAVYPDSLISMQGRQVPPGVRFDFVVEVWFDSLVEARATLGFIQFSETERLQAGFQSTPMHALFSEVVLYGDAGTEPPFSLDSMSSARDRYPPIG